MLLLRCVAKPRARLVHGRELDVVRLYEVDVADLQPRQTFSHARLQAHGNEGDAINWSIH